MDSVNPLSRCATTLGRKLYLDREKTGDVTFIVDSERIPAHRAVLAALSPKYKAQFYGTLPDPGDIFVPNVSSATFTEFIKLVYLEEADFTLENIGDILNLSKQSLVDTFIVKCETFLKSQLTGKSLVRIYALSSVYDLKTVRVLCERFIGENILKLFRNNDFLECDHGTLLHILSIEHLKCREIDMVEGCIKWARLGCQRKDLDHEENGNLRAELDDAVNKFHFKSMTIHEFAKFNETYKGFFSAEEFVEITNIICGLKTNSSKFNCTNRTAIDSSTNSTAVAQCQLPSGTKRPKRDEDQPSRETLVQSLMRSSKS